MKILVLGAGWFGCHCASILLKNRIQFKIADITNDFFTGSSSKNQNRLHLGFHYPRSYHTRLECIKGFNQFMAMYSDFVHIIPNNFYCVDKQSIIDFQSYITIYKHENIPFDIIKNFDLPLEINTNMFDGVIKVPEGFINFRNAKTYFKNKLQSYMINQYDPNLLNVLPIINYDGEVFDLLIDCTYSTITKNMFYENCISFIYKYLGDKPDFSITLMDGKFWSLYIYDLDKKLYTLTDVEYTPKGNENIKKYIEEKVKTYIPDFETNFEYQGFFTSRKAKINNTSTDDRSLVWTHEKNILKFSGGKITGIFSMEEVLKNVLILPQNHQIP